MQRSEQQKAQPGSFSLAQLLTAFTFASDLAFGLEFEDGIRSCYLAARIAEKMGLSEADRTATYYTSLLKDAGCTCYTNQIAEQRFDDLAEAFADFVDLKSPFFAAHSRRVARIAEQIALLMHCSPAEATEVRRAALMHDLGIVSVPSRILGKPEARLTASERETLRLHPYQGERIVDRVPAFDDLKPLMGFHHEHVDGSGYYRGARGRDIPLGARIIAVANRLDELTHDVPDAPGLSLSEALNVLAAEAGTVLDPEVVDVVRKNLGEKMSPAAPRTWPAGLTDREVEVLRLASKGLTRREVATVLGITENTVRHHLEHIYDKTGTTTRVGATLFAMENNLLI